MVIAILVRELQFSRSLVNVTLPNGGSSWKKKVWIQNTSINTDCQTKEYPRVDKRINKVPHLVLQRLLRIPKENVPSICVTPYPMVACKHFLLIQEREKVREGER